MTYICETRNNRKLNYFILHTRWCWKKALNDMHESPMCWNMCMTLLAEPPDTRMAKQSRKLPAYILVPGMNGWLFHTFSCLPHFALEHVVVITTAVPACLASTRGLSVLQWWQNLNSRSNCDKNMTNFGSVRRFVPSLVIQKIVKISQYIVCYCQGFG